MPLFGRPSPRQKEIRRSKTERQGTWWRRLGDRIRWGPLAMLVVCAAGAAAIVGSGREVLGLRPGQRIPRSLHARVTFRVEDAAATDLKRTQARDNAENYYALDVSLVQDIHGRLANALRIAREHAADPEKLRQRAAEIKLVFDDPGLEEIIRLAEQPDSNVFQLAVERAVRTLRAQPLVEVSEQAHRRTGINAVLTDPEQEGPRLVPNASLLYANNAEHVNQVVQAVLTAADFTPPLRETMRASLLQMLSTEGAGTFKPLFRYDTARSAQAAAEAERSVPTQYKLYKAGTRLAEAGRLDATKLALLEEEFRQYQSPELELQEPETLSQWQEARRLALWSWRAQVAIAFLVVFGLGGYLLVAHGELLGGGQRRLATALTLLLVLAAARSAYLQATLPHLAVGAYALAIALLAITSGRAPAYAVGGLLALMITVATRQGIGFLLILAASAAVLFYGLHNLRNRGRIIAVGALAALLAGITTQLAGLLDAQYPDYVLWNQTIWAALTTLAAAFLVEGILPGIERLFGVTTAMTLLEWCDPNKPLLRMLAAESPGTYNHSLLVGTLADAAAEAIGANGLLARAGAYYHDIGKINKAEYFVENQAMGVGNRHDRLSPAMSHLIIIGHVKDGIEMAREYRLPPPLRAFIPEHHGTCVVEYFYHAASRARKPGDPEVSDEQFRYPGPKPQSRETAIVMICDGVEGAVRAMTEPTPNRIEDTVERLIQKRMMDGQLDECDLTFRELQIIRTTLVKTLCSIYHARVTYPTTETTAEARSAS